MKRITVVSSNKKDTPADIADKLEKALAAIQSQRENQTMKDHFLKEKKDRADKIIDKVFDNMLNEISAILTG